MPSQRTVPLPRSHHRRPENRAPAWVDDDEVGVEAGSDPALAFMEADERGGPFAHPPGAFQTSPNRLASSRQLRYRVWTPGLPAGAWSSGRPFSSSVCGA